MGCASTKDADDSSGGPVKDKSGAAAANGAYPEDDAPDFVDDGPPAAARRPAAGGGDGGGMVTSPRPVKTRVNVPEGICPGCNKPYDKYSMKVALGNTWHPECFKCPKCGERVLGVDLFEHEGFPYHEECFTELFNPTCDECGKVLGEQYIKASGKKLHPECLKCCECKEGLLNKKIFEKEGNFFCETCYATKFKEPCKKCGKPIIGEHVEALDARFHPECLTCETCDKVLSSVEFREFKGKVYCSKHVPQPTRRMLVICSLCGETDYRKADHIDASMVDSLLCRLCEKANKQVQGVPIPGQ